MFLSLLKAGWYWITKGNIFFRTMFPFFKWPFSTGADNSRCVFLQNFVRFPLSPSSVVFLSSVRFLLRVERVRFVFRMGNAPPSYVNLFFTPRKIFPQLPVCQQKEIMSGWQGSFKMLHQIYSSNIEGFVN